AAQLCQLRKTYGKSSRMPATAYVSSKLTPEGGAPAPASSTTTATSRRWNEPYRVNINEITRANSPNPLAAATRVIKRVGASVATMSPNPSVSSATPAKYRAVERL